jgi:hypothetical protein
MRWFYAHWPRVGLALAAGVTAALAVLVATDTGRLQDPRLLLTASLVTLLLHQTEEYVWPGGFPRMVNRVMFGSDRPDRFPLNQRTAWIINVALGWSLYALAAAVAMLAPWLAIATLVVSGGNVLAHTVLFNVRGRTLYNPGLATCWLLFVPLIVWFAVLAARDDLVGPVDVAVGVLLGMAVNYLGVVRLITVLGDRDTAYPFAS